MGQHIGTTIELLMHVAHVAVAIVVLLVLPKP